MREVIIKELGDMFELAADQCDINKRNIMYFDGVISLEVIADYILGKLKENQNDTTTLEPKQS